MPLDLPRRRALVASVTSLIDVIFLLLLFFMLSSTFTRHGILELSQSEPRGANGSAQTGMAFLKLTGEAAQLNGKPVRLDILSQALSALRNGDSLRVVVDLDAQVTSQQLVDVVAILTAEPGLDFVFLE